MKNITLIYNPITEEYGINESHGSFFNDKTYTFNEENLSNKIEKYLEEKNLSKRKIGLILKKRKNGKENIKMGNLVDLIKRVNPKAIIIN